MILPFKVFVIGTGILLIWLMLYMYAYIFPKMVARKHRNTAIKHGVYHGEIYEITYDEITELFNVHMGKKTYGLKDIVVDTDDFGPICLTRGRVIYYSWYTINLGASKKDMLYVYNVSGIL